MCSDGEAKFTPPIQIENSPSLLSREAGKKVSAGSRKSSSTVCLSVCLPHFAMIVPISVPLKIGGGAGAKKSMGQLGSSIRPAGRPPAPLIATNAAGISQTSLGSTGMPAAGCCRLKKFPALEKRPFPPFFHLDFYFSECIDLLHSSASQEADRPRDRLHGWRYRFAEQNTARRRRLAQKTLCQGVLVAKNWAKQSAGSTIATSILGAKPSLLFMGLLLHSPSFLPSSSLISNTFGVSPKTDRPTDRLCPA